MTTLANVELLSDGSDHIINLVTERNLTNGSTYQLQNLFNNPIRLLEKPAGDNSLDGYWVLPAYGATCDVVIDTSNPVRAWLANTDGREALLGITLVES